MGAHSLMMVIHILTLALAVIRTAGNETQMLEIQQEIYHPDYGYRSRMRVSAVQPGVVRRKMDKRPCRRVAESWLNSFDRSDRVMSRTSDEDSFFAQERDRLVSEITSVRPSLP